MNTANLHHHEIGDSTVIRQNDSWRLTNGRATADSYVNAQLDDYHARKRSNFLHKPPLTLTLRARFSHSADLLRGTAGFGFWNDPFGMSGARLPSLPRALWFFFSSPPSNMALAQGVPGPGWKAATIDAWRWPFFLLAPTAPIAMPLMRIPALYKRLWPIGQRAIGVHEAQLSLDMTAWHDYQLAWTKDHVQFWVDGHVVLHAPQAPRGPLGLVIWKDNQAMSISPSILPRHQLVAAPEEQWMEITALEIV